MLLLALTVVLTLQVPGAAMPQASDTIDAAYDSPATRDLVERAIRNTGEPPLDLQDYRAEVHSSLFLALAPDTLVGGDLPASVDELVSEVRWNQQGFLHQEVHGQRTRILIPIPYTLATLFREPWVIPHLYGSDIFTPLTGPRAVNPFGVRGPQLYRYEADDPLRIRVQGELVTLIPVAVRPRVAAGEANVSLVVGTFFLDEERGAVARARFGFVGGTGGLPRTLGRVETFFELENALWEGAYWLPFLQRREIQFESQALGGRVAARVVNRFVDYDFNTGWSPSGQRMQLAWPLQQGQAAFAGWDRPVGADAGAFSTEDFADLRLATAVTRPGEERWRTQLHYRRGNHLFRYNRVEGAFVGLGGRLVPPDPRRNRFELYGTAGWAFAEGTPRGELSARWGAAVARAPNALGLDRGLEVGVYRRLVDIQPFRPTYTWDWIYTLPAALWGTDVRDYYGATGVELAGSLRGARWSGRLGGRWEQHDSLQINTERFLFGTAAEFGPLAAAEPGRHLALEAGTGYAFGPGAFGMGNSIIARADAEVGVGDFRFTRVAGLLSLRQTLEPVTLAARVDAGHAWGGVPPQKLFRFGSIEGLRGYAANEFGGSTAVLARSRVLIGLPPRTPQPLARRGMFLIPPLRPALVLLGESGYTWIDRDLEGELRRLRARPTLGWRSSVGVGISIFEDAITLERLQPVGDAEGVGARWYFGLSYWY